RSGADGKDGHDAASRCRSEQRVGRESNTRRRRLLVLSAESARTLFLARHAPGESNGGTSRIKSLTALLRRRKRPAPRRQSDVAHGGGLLVQWRTGAFACRTLRPARTGEAPVIQWIIAAPCHPERERRVWAVDRQLARSHLLDATPVVGAAEPLSAVDHERLAR